MSKPTHSIRTQAVEVVAESEELALALQPRMSDVNRRHLLPVIERVLDEFDVPGRHIRLDKLKVNLGRLRFAHFEEEAAERLYVELRKALAEVLREPGDRSRPEGAAHTELLEHYLLRGALPFWAPRAAESSPQTFFLELLDVEPAGVAALVRRLGRQTRVLERLVLCFGETFLRRLLRLLEPEHAALILVYMLNLRDVHRVEPLLPLGERPFTRLVWLLVLSYLVEEPGSQFNRKSFVKSLLEGMAASEGLSYVEIVRTLRLGLRQTMHRYPVKSSLPGVIEQLIRELGLEDAESDASAPPSDAPGAAASHETRAETKATPADTGTTRTTNTSADIEAMRAGAPHADAEDALTYDKALARLERYLTTGETAAGETTTVETTLKKITADETAEARVPQVDQESPYKTTFEARNETVEARAPQADGTEQEPARRETAAHSGDADLRDAFRLLAERNASGAGAFLRRLARAATPGSSAVVGRLLRAFTPEELLAVLLPEHAQDLLKLVELLREVSAAPHATGTQAPRAGAMWREVLAAILHESPGRPGLSASVRSAFGVASARLGVSPVQLAEMLERAPKLDAAEARDGAERKTRELLTRVSRRVRARASQQLKGTDSPEQLRPTDLARTVFARYDLSQALRYYLDRGVLPWSALLREPALTAEAVVAHLLVLTRPALRRLLTREDPAEQLRVVLRAVELLPDEGCSKLLLRLLPRAENEGAAAALLSSLPAFAPEGGGRHVLYARVIAAILEDRPVDLEELYAAGSLPPAAEFILPSNPDEWEPHLLKSAVVNRLRFGEAAGAAGHTREELLGALLSRHPSEARHFLRAVGGVQGMRATFVRECPAPLLDRGLELLHPDWAESLRALAHSVTRIAAPYRTLSEEGARRVIFDEALRARTGESLTASFFLRVLRRLFEVPLAERVSEVLLREAGAWAARGNLPAEHAAAFESAVRTAAVQQAQDVERDADEERRDAEERAAEFARASVFAFLLGTGAAPRKAEASRRGPVPQRQEPLKLDTILHELERMIEESPSEVYDFIRQHLADAHTRERWVKLLPESTLVRLSYLLEPRKHRALLDAAEVLDAAWAEAAPPGHPSLYGRGVLWSFLLEFLTRSSGPNRTTEQFVAAFFEHYAARYLAAAPGATDRARVGAGMLERAAAFARVAGQAVLHALLRRERAQLLAPWESSNAVAARTPVADAKTAARHSAREGESQRPAPRRGRMAFGMVEDKEEGTGEPIYIDNAGLVLTGPFIPAFFQSLDLLGADEHGAPRLRDRWCASRAVHLLQYLVDGRTDASEPLLVLNKILCGLPTSTPVESEIEITVDERAACERLLKSVIANWTIIERTSIAGLQETFLRREGRLEHSDSGWRLTVQRKTLDVLVDQIPWSVSVIYQRWMPRPLYVTW